MFKPFTHLTFEIKKPDRTVQNENHRRIQAISGVKTGRDGTGDVYEISGT